MSRKLSCSSEHMLWAGADPAVTTRNSKGHLRRLNRQIWPGEFCISELATFLETWEEIYILHAHRNLSSKRSVLCFNIQKWCPEKHIPKEKSLLNTRGNPSPPQGLIVLLSSLPKAFISAMAFVANWEVHVWYAMAWNRASHVYFILHWRLLSHQLASPFLETIIVM